MHAVAIKTSSTYRDGFLNSTMFVPTSYHLERIQRAATGWVKGPRDLSYEERLKTIKLQPFEKRRIRNDLVLTHKIMYK